MSYETIWDDKENKFIKQKKVIKDKTLTFRTTEDDLTLIERITKAYEMTTSDFIYQAVHMLLEKYRSDMTEVIKAERIAEAQEIFNKTRKPEDYVCVEALKIFGVDVVDRIIKEKGKEGLTKFMESKNYTVN